MTIHIKSFVSALAFSLLFYSKSLGLNLILIAVLASVLVSTLGQERPVSWGFTLTYIATSIFVFLNPTGFTIFVHLMAFLVFVGKSISPKSSVYLSWLLGSVNMLIGSAAHAIQSSHEAGGKVPIKLSATLGNRLKGALVALLLLLLFGLLYKNANPVFGNLVAQINFDFISLPWVFFTLLGYLLFFHLLRPFYAQELIAYDLAQTNELEKPTELTLIGQKKRLEAEHTLGSMVFLALNLLLLFFLVTDVIYLLDSTTITNAGYSNAVHQGVYALMFSIVCAIALILYFFRGNLNFFQGNQRIKTLTLAWIALNIILVACTAYKNFTYVEALGLTYKRIGVFVYLALTLTGLVTAYTKVTQLKNFTYLLRTNVATLFAFLVVSAAVPWDRTITQYNLAALEQPDMAYLISLGAANSTQLHQYAQINPLEAQTEARITEKHNAFVTAQAQKTWQEYTWYQFKNHESK